MASVHAWPPRVVVWCSPVAVQRAASVSACNSPATFAVPIHPENCTSQRVPRFRPIQRIRQKSDFDAAYRTGSKIGDTCFFIVIRPNQQGMARLGLSISARTVGIAVNRNRIKRVIRESFRLHQHLLPAADLIVNSRTGARDADNAVLAQRLEQLWKTVVKRCAAS